MKHLLKMIIVFIFYHIYLTTPDGASNREIFLILPHAGFYAPSNWFKSEVVTVRNCQILARKLAGVSIFLTILGWLEEAGLTINGNTIFSDMGLFCNFILVWL